jgi:ABC-type Fe3+/spermidine/putrescine transport system ATPase subunit
MYSVLLDYTDFNGDPCKERLYFNITRAELQKQNMHTKGGLLSYLTRIIATRDQEEIATYFEKIVDMSYGIKSDDGKKFTKTEEITKEFMSTAAYDELFFRLTTDDKFASDFVNGILPKELFKEENNNPETEAEIKKLYEEMGIEPPKKG